MVSLMLGGDGLLCAAVDPRCFADASEVPATNKAAATTIRADLLMVFFQALGNQTSSYGLCD
jgi:hypothetical protein